MRDIKKLIKQAGVPSVRVDDQPKDNSNIWATVNINSVTPVTERLKITVYRIRLYANKDKQVLHERMVDNIIAQANLTPTFSFSSSDNEDDDTWLVQQIIIAQSGRINKE